MQIHEANLQFNGGFRTRPYTKRIVVHHSASDIGTTIRDIHQWHLNRDYAGVGYHYVIYPDGSIWRGRPEWARGAHAYQDPQHDANVDGMGICLIGNFQTSKPTTAQMESLVWLIQDIHIRFPGIAVIGHKHVMPTACPGALFPWKELYARLEDDEMTYKTLNDVPDWGKPVVQKLINRGSLAGDGKGNINLPESTLKTLVILDREGVLK
ncbi:MAG TPA: hypothetical protein DCZ10_13925 [Pelotomaculum sp.]|mgnify:FL=1|nr:hypothetical protein [Pelotomaculum sp.]